MPLLTCPGGKKLAQIQTGLLVSKGSPPWNVRLISFLVLSLSLSDNLFVKDQCFFCGNNESGFSSGKCFGLLDALSAIFPCSTQLKPEWELFTCTYMHVCP